ncbi:maleylacetoacetate isomerase [Backusella circina FSU 941]|nr:maleylacetoacetate isomerase [Backusella circina FSU 941]
MSEQKPVLYGYFRSSASWRVRIALAWKGVDYEKKYINLAKGEQKTEEFAKVVPTQKVPAFVTKEGQILSQSAAIMEYLEETYPDRPMLPKGIYERAVVTEISQIIACDIHPLQNLGVLIKIAGSDLEKRKEWANRVITDGFKGLEKRLKVTSGSYSCGDSITMADFYLASIVGNANRWEVDMSQFPIISRISNALATLPEFKEASPTNQPDCDI